MSSLKGVFDVGYSSVENVKEVLCLMVNHVQIVVVTRRYAFEGCY